MATASTIRLANVESRARLSAWLGVAIIAVNCIGIIATLYVLFSLGSTLNERAGLQLLEDVRADFDRYLVLEKDARGRMETSRGLENQLNIDHSEEAIIQLSKTLVENEKSYQIFFRLLKVNIYHLTNFIPGSYSWYEIWSPEIESAIERSRLRQRRALEVQRFYELRVLGNQAA